ncbi:MAG: tryptophan--tRNA ligase [Alphaproteobacteria bacterium]|nr:tryptophan--tRNA ligase [Alphaproteobacteria bacterium]
MKRIFSGVQPTGNLHLGNYLGAIRNWVNLQNEFECIFCMVDMHAITVWQDPEELRKNTRELAVGMIASGIDPEKNILFNQSRVSAHAELAWVLNCVARLGWLGRMTQFKEKAGKDKENSSVGLFAYPNLMAADILAYKATHVPVGHDQKQHLELTRDIAKKFNTDFKKEVFPIPEPLILGAGARVMSLRDGSKKMSKSDLSEYSRINMTDDADAIAKKLRKAKTDPLPLPSTMAELEGRPEAVNLIGIYAALKDSTVEKVLPELEGKQFSEFKKDITDLAVSVLEPISSEMSKLMKDTSYIDDVLRKGAERARVIAEPVIKEVYDTVGFLRD